MFKIEDLILNRPQKTHETPVFQGDSSRLRLASSRVARPSSSAAARHLISGGVKLESENHASVPSSGRRHRLRVFIRDSN